MNKDIFHDLNPERICIIKPSALGDVVQTLPIVPVLKEKYPRAKITWVINAGLEDLVQHHPDIDDVILYHRKGSWRAQWEMAKKLRAHRFDLVLDLQGLLRTGLMALATGAKLRVGLETAREGSSFAYHHQIPDTSKHVPANLRYWRVAEALGNLDLQAKTTIPVPQNVSEKIRQLLAPLPGKVMGIQAGARWVTKRWPVEKFAQVAQRAMEQHSASVVLIGSRDEADLADELAGKLTKANTAGRILNLCGRTNMQELISLVQQIDVLLTNDSGPMHLAAGLGTPVAGIFLCTSATRSGPVGTGHQTISSNVSCAASYHKTCPQRGTKHMSCMEELEAHRVSRALDLIFKAMQPMKRVA
jgi:lipopolysaccharide heptosyltransferase I